MKKIYVCASFEDALLVQQIEKALREKGFEITSNWTNHINENEKLAYAKEDFDGIVQCDILVCWNNGRRSMGKITEIGMALGMRKLVLVFGEKYTGIFESMVVNCEFPSSLNALVGIIDKVYFNE